MTKQSDQGFIERPSDFTCMHCKHISTPYMPKWIKTSFERIFFITTAESLSCGIGDFKVKASSTCTKWSKSNEQS